MTVTRIELASYVQAAFADGPVTRDRLLAYATGSHARPAVIAALQRLKNGSYRSVPELWNDLSDIPVGTG